MILEKIADRTRERVAERRKRVPLSRLQEEVQRLPANSGFPFEKAIAGAELSFICEVKKASPSKGLIAPDFPWLQIARDYEEAGAAAVSVLTEPDFFMGSDRYLQEIAAEVHIPVLRKDFTVDEYMIYEARLLGASAVLLICSLLHEDELKRYLRLADSLGLSALVEAHDGDEVKKGLECGARIIGVNNRDLKTFQVDIRNSVRLRELVPEEILFVSESGMKTAEDIRILKENGTNAVLIGETLMRSPHRRRELEKLRGQL